MFGIIEFSEIYILHYEEKNALARKRLSRCNTNV